MTPSTISDSPRDYRVQVRLRNNRILTRVERLGFDSIPKFCARHQLSYANVIDLIGLRLPAQGRSGWTKAAIDLATALHCEPEELFTERQARADIKAKVEREVDEDQVMSLSAPEAQRLIADMPAVDEEVGRRQAVDDFLESLTPRCRDIVKRRFGFDGPEETCDQIALDYGISGQRIRQITEKMLRKGRSLQQIRRLGPYADARFVAKCEAELAEAQARALRETKEAEARRDTWELEQARLRADQANKAKKSTESRLLVELDRRREEEKLLAISLRAQEGPVGPVDRFCRFCDHMVGDYTSPFAERWYCRAAGRLAPCYKRRTKDGDCGDEGRLFQSLPRGIG